MINHLTDADLHAMALRHPTPHRRGPSPARRAPSAPGPAHGRSVESHAMSTLHISRAADRLQPGWLHGYHLVADLDRQLRRHTQTR